MRVYQDKPTPFAVKSEPAFITSGFKNWKKAIEKFKAHESSHTHRHAVSVTAQEKHPVNAQLSSALANTQSVWGKSRVQSNIWHDRDRP